MASIIGPVQVQVGEIVTYTLSPEYGIAHTWAVDGGTIIGGQGSCSIQVQWTRVGPGQVQVTVQKPQGGTDIIIIDTDAN